MPTLEWDIESCIRNCSPKQGHISQIKKNQKPLFSEEITPELIMKAYRIIADIINRHGDTYLPLFERLHVEVQKYKEQQDLITLAKNISTNHLSTDLNDVENA